MNTRQARQRANQTFGDLFNFESLTAQDLQNQNSLHCPKLLDVNKGKQRFPYLGGGDGGGLGGGDGGGLFAEKKKQNKTKQNKIQKIQKIQKI